MYGNIMRFLLLALLRMVLHGLKIWAVAVTVCVCVTNVASVPSNSSLVEDGLYPQMFNESVTLNGLRAEPHDNKYGGYTDGLVARIMTWENTKVRIFGHGIVQSTTVKLTLTPAARGTDCAEFPTGESLHVEVCGDDEVECAMIHVLLQEIGRLKLSSSLSAPGNASVKSGWIVFLLASKMYV